MNNAIIQTILDRGAGVIAISRGNYGDKLLAAAEAIYRAGVRAVEVTFEQDKPAEPTARAIRRLCDEFGGGQDPMAVGAGTVLTGSQLLTAADAGAQFIVSPNTDGGIIAETKKLGLISIPGAMTPTELVNAALFGADIIKLFPAGALGVEYFRAVATPLRHLRIAAVGGVTVQNLREFKKAGACAFGISSSILNNALVEKGDLDAVFENAAAFMAAAES